MLTGTLVILLVAAYLAILVAVMFVLSHWSGWRQVAQVYPRCTPAPDADRGIGSIAFTRWGGYNNCIRWHADDDYLHLRIIPPFSMFHPPLSIPWTEIDIEPSRHWLGLATLHFGGRTWRVTAGMVRRELRLRRLLAESDQRETRSGGERAAAGRTPPRAVPDHPPGSQN